MYLLALSVVYCLAYLTMFFGLSFFFNNRYAKLNVRSVKSIGIILAFYFTVLMISGSVADAQWSNRILHTFGGGFLIVLVAFFALRDSKTKINRFQFIVVALSIAALFGSANEIGEFFLQQQLGFRFASSVYDTWLDLVSNGVGSILASLLLVGFIQSKKYK